MALEFTRQVPPSVYAAADPPDSNPIWTAIQIRQQVIFACALQEKGYKKSPT
jgi:hypothetical protein